MYLLVVPVIPEVRPLVLLSLLALATRPLAVCSGTGIASRSLLLPPVVIAVILVATGAILRPADRLGVNQMEGILLCDENDATQVRFLLFPLRALKIVAGLSGKRSEDRGTVL